MKETKIIYKCDICREEVNGDIELMQIEIPYKQSDSECRTCNTHLIRE